MSHELAFVCPHVFDGSRPVLVVSREGGDWQFLCGGGHGESERPHVVGLGHLIERDGSLRDVLDLDDDWEAERSSEQGEWERQPCEPEN